MEDTNGEELLSQTIDKEADLMDQLKCCQIYFHHISNNVRDLGKISQLYDNLRIVIGIAVKLPVEIERTSKEIIRNICISLVKIIASCSLPLDGQLLCSTAFCSFLHIVLSLEETRDLFDCYLHTEKNIFVSWDQPADLQISVQNIDEFKVCLCHGILKINETSNILYQVERIYKSLIYEMFNILETACMKYSRLTGIAFKVLVLWLNKISSEPECYVSSDVLRRIFTIVNSNWESPLSGIKEQNMRLFDLLLDVCSANSTNKVNQHLDTTFQSVTNLLHHVMEEQSWKMKSKFLMLSALVPRYGVRKAFAEFPDLAPDLLSSLSFSHLASAGGDAYRCFIKDLDVDDWIAVFLTPVVTLLTDEREVVSIEKQNLFNYWIPSTLKIFPAVLNIILEQLIEASNHCGFKNNIFCIFSLLKLGKKGGLFCNMYEENFSLCSLRLDEFLNLLNLALEHSNEAVRAEGFAVVCSSSRTRAIPSGREFELLQKFLLENVNADSSFLRQAILKSFTLFLTRVKDSGLHELNGLESKHNFKISENKFPNSEINRDKEIAMLTPTIQFFEWLHSFLISNLEPGTNYQRKILSLHLYKLVLSCFNEKSQELERNCGRRKKVAQDGEKLMHYALNLGKWHFSSDESHRSLLRCILDPTDDVRETAGLILMEFFNFKDLDVESSKPFLEYALHLCSSPLFYETESGALLMKVLGSWTYKLPQENRDKVICKMENVNTKRSAKMNRDKNTGRTTSLTNQEKLLMGLVNKPKISTCEQGEQKEDIKIELKERVPTFEGLTVRSPSEFLQMGNDNLPGIFEGLSVISKDGIVGQQSVFPDASYTYDTTHSSKNYKSSFSESENLGPPFLSTNKTAVHCTFPSVVEKHCETDLREDILHPSKSENVECIYSTGMLRNRNTIFISGNMLHSDTTLSVRNKGVKVKSQLHNEIEKNLKSKTTNSLYGEFTSSSYWDNELPREIYDTDTDFWGQEANMDAGKDSNASVKKIEPKVKSQLQNEIEENLKSKTNSLYGELSSWSDWDDEFSTEIYNTGTNFLEQEANIDTVKDSNASVRSKEPKVKSQLHNEIEENLKSKTNSLYGDLPSWSDWDNEFSTEIYNTDTDFWGQEASIDTVKDSNVQLQTSTLSPKPRRSRSSSKRTKFKNLFKNRFDDWTLSSSKSSPFSPQTLCSSSSSGYESPKFQQPNYSREYVNSDQETHTKSQDRSRHTIINSDIFESPKENVTYSTSSVTHENSAYKKSFEDKPELNPIPYNGTAPLSMYLVLQAETQLLSLKKNIFEAACSGSPLHGTLTALDRIAAQTSGPEFGCMSADEVNRTVKLLENAVSFLLDLLAVKSSSKTDVAPSFAEMDEAIKCSIEDSLCNLEMSEEEAMQLSPAHQLVHNCIWLNLKACCSLASNLSCIASTCTTILRRCGGLITTVLTRCRHKGAIESAGVALSSFVKTVTSDTNSQSKEEGQTMLRQYLTEFLELLVCGSIKGSVTRRSAGLSIMINKIVANDMQMGKPLLHMCVSRLLDVAQTPTQQGASSSSSIVIDLPQAQALHFLRILVLDSSLRQDMAQYISSVALVCFSIFSSSEWTIRNAALQLSGALIPKLVGQKKSQDEDGTVGNDVSLEEFFNHFPDLTNFILGSLLKATHCDNSQILQQHADIVPMMTLLTKVSVGMTTFMDDNLIEKIAHFRLCFQHLMSSPIYQVRKMVAKAHERFIPLSHSYNTILSIIETFEICFTKCDEIHINENKLNGILLMLKYLLKKIGHENRNTRESESNMLLQTSMVLKKAMNNSKFWNSCTYFNRVLILEILEDDSAANETVYFSSDEVLKHIVDVHNVLQKEEILPLYQPGLFLWAAKVIEVSVKKCCTHDLVTVWYNSYILCGQSSAVVSTLFRSLKWRLQCDDKLDDVIKSSLFILLIKIGLQISEDAFYYTLFPLCEAMLMLIENVKLNTAVAFRELQDISRWCLNENSGKSDYSIIALPLVTGLLSQYFAVGHNAPLSHQILQFVSELAECISNRSDPIQFEEDCRYNAAKALHLLVPSLPKMLELAKEDTAEEMSNIIESLLNSELVFLQDEDYEVRQEASKFVVTYCTEINQIPEGVSWNPCYSFSKLVKPEVLLTLLSTSRAVEFLWKKLLYTNELQDTKIRDKNYGDTSYEVTSPFDHGTRNIYSEETKVIDILGMSLLEVLKIASSEEKDKVKKLVTCRSVDYKDDATTVLSMLSTRELCGISSLSNREILCIIGKKIVYQSQVMAALDIEKDCDIESVIVELRKVLYFS